MKYILLIILISLICGQQLMAVEQIIEVGVAEIDSPRASLSRWEKINGHWKKTGEAFDVVIGKNGIGRGIGFGETEKTKLLSYKKEGDKRTPGGIFRLGKAYGYAKLAPEGSFFPYQQSRSTYKGVDDVNSRYYNQIVDEKLVEKDWTSSETILRKDNLYKWLITIEHNHENKPEFGSQIFLHVWRGPNSSTAGCVAMKEEKIIQILKWLDPKKEPLIVIHPMDEKLDTSLF